MKEYLSDLILISANGRHVFCEPIDIEVLGNLILGGLEMKNFTPLFLLEENFGNLNAHLNHTGRGFGNGYGWGDGDDLYEGKSSGGGYYWGNGDGSGDHFLFQEFRDHPKIWRILSANGSGKFGSGSGFGWEWRRIR